jgi:hypothetical protein
MRVSGKAWAIGAGLTVWVSIPVAHAQVDSIADRPRGDVAARSFSELCAGELPESRRRLFYSGLDKTEARLAQREPEAARSDLENALQAAYRGDADTDISVKCLGEPTARRWHDAELELSRQEAASDPRGILFVRAGLYVVAADHGAEGVRDAVGRQPARRFVSSLRVLEGIVDRIEHERRFGAFILAKEEEIAKACRAAIGPLRERAAREHRDALAAETQTFTRPISEAELTTMNAADDARALSEAMTGVPVDSDISGQSWLTHIRASESMALLKSARDWNLDAGGEVSALPSSRRAFERGEQMLALANDTAHGLFARDAYYEDAERYLDFGDFSTEAKSAASARAKLQPALQAQQARQREAADEAREKMEGQARSATQAAERMKKSESEKRRFEEEADALEAELGF